MTNYITINRPNQVNNIGVKKQVEQLVKNGVRSTDILLKMEFVCSDSDLKIISDKFRVLKNHAFFNHANS